MIENQETHEQRQSGLGGQDDTYHEGGAISCHSGYGCDRGLLVIRKLKTEGKSSGIPVILVAMVMSLLVIGVVLFTVV